MKSRRSKWKWEFEPNTGKIFYSSVAYFASNLIWQTRHLKLHVKTQKKCQFRAKLWKFRCNFDPIQQTKRLKFHVDLCNTRKKIMSVIFERRRIMVGNDLLQCVRLAKGKRISGRVSLAWSRPVIRNRRAKANNVQ